MYKVNHKIVSLSIVCQIIACVCWLVYAPYSPAKLDPIALGFSSLALVLAIISYVYFYAWILNKMMISSKLEMCVIIFMTWLFYLVPNLVIATEVLDIEGETILYILCFSASAVLINAIILPFSRSSRSIFKT